MNKPLQLGSSLICHVICDPIQDMCDAQCIDVISRYRKTMAPQKERGWGGICQLSHWSSK